MKNVRFLPHAEGRLHKRDIDIAWVFDTIREPEYVEADPRYAGRERWYRRIAPFGHRWLRVVVEEGHDEIVVVTFFFDRNAGRRL